MPTPRLPLMIAWLLLSSSALSCQRAASPEPATAAQGPRRFQVAITLDDLPWHGGLVPGDTRTSANQRILTALRDHHVPATGFVVCERVAPEAPILRAWLDAGMELGNHSTSHPHLAAMSLDAWETNVRGCRDRLREITGAPVRWFRYPYLQMGRTAERRDEARQIVAQLHHDVAHVSIDTGEWALVDPYVRAKTRGDNDEAEVLGLERQAWRQARMASPYTASPTTR